MTFRTIAVLLVCLAGAFTVSAQTPEPSGTVYQTTNVRSGPGIGFEIVGQLAEGDAVALVGRDVSGDWVRVRSQNADGTIGWLSAFAILAEVDLASLPIVGAEVNDLDDEVTDTPDLAGVAVTATGRVNVREGPNIDTAIVGQLAVGEGAIAIARSNSESDWLLIDSETVSGWVAYFTVTSSDRFDALPILTPDASGDALVPPSSLARTRFNVRLHSEQGLNSPVIAIIPFNTVVTPIGLSADRQWLLVAYQELTGWGTIGLFSLRRGALDDLPILREPTAIPGG